MFDRASDGSTHTVHWIEVDRTAIPSRDGHEGAGDRTQPCQSEDVDTTANGKIRHHGLTLSPPVLGR